MTSRDDHRISGANWADESVADAAWKNILFLIDGPSPRWTHGYNVWQATLLREIRIFAKAAREGKKWPPPTRAMTLNNPCPRCGYHDAALAPKPAEVMRCAGDYACGGTCPACTPAPRTCPRCAKAEALAGAVEALCATRSDNAPCCGCVDCWKQLEAVDVALAAWREGK